MNFSERALSAGDRLTDMEDELVRYISSNKGNIMQIKIVDLAKQFYTVPNTITRLCKKLGYVGFSEMKNEIKHELAIDFHKDIPQKKLLLKNFDLIDSEREKKVVQLFMSARRVNFFSIGQTAYATKIFVDDFNTVDSKFVFHTYPNELRHTMSQSTKELFFFVSLSGEKKQVLDLAKEAKAKHHTIISLTGITTNSLSQLADICLFCYSPENKVRDYTMTDKTPLFIIMNSLFQMYIS